jgi:hypothetical protein
MRHILLNSIRPSIIIAFFGLSIFFLSKAIAQTSTNERLTSQEVKIERIEKDILDERSQNQVNKTDVNRLERKFDRLEGQIDLLSLLVKSMLSFLFGGGILATHQLRKIRQKITSSPEECPALRAHIEGSSA